MNKKQLLQIAKNHLKEKEWTWISQKIQGLQEAFKPRAFYLAFSACPRFIEKETLQLTEAEQQEMEAIYPNFNAVQWTKDEWARIMLMTQLPVDANQKVLDRLFGTADYRELMALYKGLYFLENAQDFMLRAREGLRTNMVGVFDAIALNNPYPHKYLTEDAWNQMVLKAMFMERPLYKVFKIEERKNPKLALIFLDYAHERWSAHRKVSPELWRFVSGYVDDVFFEDIKKTIQGKDALERIAATKALIESNYPKGHQWLQAQNISTANLPTWDSIGKQFNSEW